jgi:O-antigen/teichoic acid export membrane protein
MDYKKEKFLPYLLLLLIVNVIVKPIWVFGIDASVQQHIGNHGYGMYYSTLNLVLLGNILLDFGLSNSWVATNQTTAINYIQIIKAKLLFSLIYILFIAIIAFIVGVPSVALCIPLVLLQIGNSFLMMYRFFLQGIGKNWLNVLASVFDRILAAIIIIAIITIPQFLSLSALSYSWVQCIAVLISILILFLIFKKELTVVGKLDTKQIRQLIKNAIPFATVLFLTTLLFRADVFFIKNLHPNAYEEVATYAYGFRILDALNNFGFLAGSYLFIFFIQNINDKKRIFQNSKIITFIFLLCTSIAVVVLWFGGNTISNLLYHTYTYRILQIMLHCTIAFAGCILFHIYGTLLIAAKQFTTISILLVASIIFMFVLHIIYTPAYGALAAAIITAVVQLCLGIACVVCCKQKKLI